MVHMFGVMHKKTKMRLLPVIFSVPIGSTFSKVIANRPD